MTQPDRTDMPPLTPEQEEQVRGAWSECYVNLPGHGRCGVCAGCYLAAALATVNGLRDSVTEHLEIIASQGRDLAALRAEVARLEREAQR